jgi:hypothetical protein
MKRHIFLLIILIVIFGCAEREISKPMLRQSVSSPLPSSETRDRPVTWDGSPNLEPGLNPKDILLFEDFEDDHYQQRWKTHWGKAVGAGTVEKPSQYVFAGNRSAYMENKKGYHDANGTGQYVPEIPIDDVAYFRLYLRLQDGFSTGTTNQVKLIAMRGAVDVENTYGGERTGREQIIFQLTCASITHGVCIFTTIIPINWGDGVTSLTANCLFSNTPKSLRGSGIV